MKTFVIGLVIIIAFSLVACNNIHPDGIYVCDKSNKKADTTVHADNNDTGYVDLTCKFEQVEFKGNNTVVLFLPDGQQYPTSYVVDKEYIRIKTTGPDLLLKMKDKNTMVAEGDVMQGVYNRK